MKPERLDTRVSRQFGLSRRAAREAVLNGKVDLGDRTVQSPGLFVAHDQDLTMHQNRPIRRRVSGNALRVLHEDEHVLIVDKPPGLLTLPSAAHEPDTLVERVRRYLEIRYRHSPYVGVIHRLDRETSGALAFARSSESLHAFQAIFRQHQARRLYLAVVTGQLERTRGTISLPLSLDRSQCRRRIAGREEPAERAITHYELVEDLGVASLLSCRLETGRTHQIRIHMAGMGHPVVGDELYRRGSRRQQAVRFHRQALHARGLGFRHPLTGADIDVEAPMPHDLQSLIESLRRRRDTAAEHTSRREAR